MVGISYGMPISNGKVLFGIRSGHVSDFWQGRIYFYRQEES